MTKIYNFNCHNLNLPAVFQCNDWTSHQVAEWLNGVDDGMAPYIRHFITHNINGNKLLNVDNDTLKRIGVNREATRTKIISAINLLLYYSYSIKYENLQKLALKTRVSSNELLESVSIATPIINNSSNASMHIEVLNNVLGALASIYENTIRLIFWLERNPFVENKKFVKMRNNLATFIDEMIDCVNNPNNPKFFSVPQLLIERAKMIQQLCNEIINLPDPSILYTAFLDRIIIRRPPNADWGFEIGRTCLGINLITRVDYNSPLAFADKFDVGDEIIEINGQSVIGWKKTSLLRRLNEKQQFLLPGQQQFSNLENVETRMLLCKRPRESCSPQRFFKVQDGGNGDQETKRLTKLALDFKNKIGTNFSMRWHRNQKEYLKDVKKHENNNLALRRVRSSSFTANVNSNSRRCSDCSLPQASRCISLLIPMGKQQLFRRASVWNESPPGTLHSPFKDSNSWLLLLASWGTENRLTPSNRPERIQKRPPPLKGILESGVSVVVDKGETKEEKEENGIIFSSVEIVPENELIKIGRTTTLSVIVEPEWNAPVKEITGISTQQPFAENCINPVSIISESPLSTIHAKIARFFYGESIPSPSPSSIIQQNSPTNNELIKNNKINNNNIECKTPITPNSTKYSLELPFNSSSSLLNNSNKLGNESNNSGYGGGCCGSSSSLCSVDSPSYISTTILKTTCTNKNRLAPLAEPDEVGDFLQTFVPLSISENLINNNSLLSPIIEGLILREFFQSENNKKQIFKASFKRKRWTKCWGLIKDGYFYIKENELSTEIQFLIDLSINILITKPEIQTSKKYIFLLKNVSNKLKLHFAFYSFEEFKKWTEAIIFEQKRINNKNNNILEKSFSNDSNNYLFNSSSNSMIVNVVNNNNITK